MDGTARMMMSRRDWACCEPDSLRYAIGGVCVRKAKRGAWLLATSGFHLSVRRDESAVIGSDFTQAIVPNVCRGVKDEELGINTLAKDVASTATRHAGLIEGRFPKVHEVVKPTPKDAAVVMVRPQYLVDIAKLVSGEEDGSVYLLIDKESKSIRVVGKKGIGVVMCESFTADDAKDAMLTFDSMAAELKADLK